MSVASPWLSTESRGWMVEGLGTQVLREVAEFRLGSGALQDLLIDDTGYPERVSARRYLCEVLRSLVLFLAYEAYPYGGVDEVQGQRPSRRAR